jgi:hypothetical protein
MRRSNDLGLSVSSVENALRCKKMQASEEFYGNFTAIDSSGANTTRTIQHLRDVLYNTLVRCSSMYWWA